MIGQTARFLRIRWILVLLLSLLWTTTGGATALAVRGDFDHPVIAAKTPASFFQSTRIEVEALQAQGLSRSAAFSQIRSFNAGNADGYLFHFTSPKGGRGILNDGFINPSTSGVVGPGVYTGTTPTPSWFTKNVPFAGWGLGGKGANVRIPIQTTQPSVTPWLPPQTRVFRDPLPIGGGN
jgi:hypothetical protein